MEVNDATTTYDCKHHGCTNEARSRVGRYSYCDFHREQRAALPSAPNGSPNGTTAAKIKSLSALASKVDALHAKAAKLTVAALKMKQQADDADREFRRQARELLGEDVS
jgi:hypothetical protein